MDAYIWNEALSYPLARHPETQHPLCRHARLFTLPRMTEIRITALRHSAFYSPLLLAIAGSYLRDEGLTPVYTPATPSRPAHAGVVNGDFHLTQSAVAVDFAALERGEPPPTVHFAQINARDGFFLCSREPRANFQWRDLIGRRVLVDHFFQPLAMLRYALHRVGVAWEHIQVVDAGDVAAIERAFRAGAGDFVHLQGPAAQQLEHDGIAHVVAAVGDVVGPVAFSSLCARRDWCASDMARAFMRGYTRARKYCVQAPPADVAAQIAPLLPGVAPAVLLQTVTRYRALGCWEPATEIAPASYESLLDVFLFAGVITRRHPYAALIAPPPSSADR